MGNHSSHLDGELRLVRTGSVLKEYQEGLKQAVDNGTLSVLQHFQDEMEYYREMAQKEMTMRLCRLGTELDAQLKTEKDKHATREKKLLDQLEQAREQAKSLDTKLKEQLRRERELLRESQQAREQAKSVDHKLQEQLRWEKELLRQSEQAREQAKSVDTKLQEQLRWEKELLRKSEQAREQAKTMETNLQEELWKEKEHLRRSEQAREQAKATEARLQDLLDKAHDQAKSAETQLQEQLRKEHELVVQTRQQLEAAEARLQEQLRKEQEGKEQEIEGRLRLAIEEEKARVHQELYKGFVEHFTKEKALLMERMRKDIEEMGGNMKKEVKMKLDEIVRVDELQLEEEVGQMRRQESDCAAARD